MLDGVIFVWTGFGGRKCWRSNKVCGGVKHQAEIRPRDGESQPSI